jgi:hypothetical protein
MGVRPEVLKHACPLCGAAPGVMCVRVSPLYVGPPRDADGRLVRGPDGRWPRGHLDPAPIGEPIAIAHGPRIQAERRAARARDPRPTAEIDVPALRAWLREYGDIFAERGR